MPTFPVNMVPSTLVNKVRQGEDKERLQELERRKETISVQVSEVGSSKTLDKCKLPARLLNAGTNNPNELRFCATVGE